MKNKIFTILIATILLMPVSVQAVEDADIVQDVATTQNEIETVTEDIYKQPVSKRKIAKKFLLAMSGVAISSITIFVMLTIYNRLRENFTAKRDTSDEEISLETPEDIQSAVKSFLSKTDWK